jgi:putative salt-induced outer membrane protein YdiY
MTAFAGIAAALVLAADPATDAQKPPEWKGTVGAGLIYVDGNAYGLTGSLAAAGERKSVDWIDSGRATATYGVARAAGEIGEKTSAYAAGLLLRLDRRWSPALSTYALASAETDHVKGLEWRPGGEVGLGYAWIDSRSGDEAVFLRTDLGLHLAKDFRFQYDPTPLDLPDADLFVAPRLAVAFRCQLSKTSVFSEDAEVLPNLNGPSRVLVNSTAKVGARLSAAMQLGVAFTATYDSAPARGKKATDTVLAVTLDYVF